MENTNNKIITMSLMTLSILLWIIVKVVTETVAGMAAGPVGRALNTDFAMHVMPVLLAVVVFFVLQFNKKVTAWADEVVTEIRKVVWPSRKDTIAMTIVVCIMLAIAAVVVGGFDIVSGYTIDALLNLNL